MSTKKFITKTVIKLVVFAIIFAILGAAIDSVTPVINNDLALGQMENSDDLFIIYNTYNRLVTFVYGLYGICITVIVCHTGYDIYKFIKAKAKEKNENEEK